MSDFIEKDGEKFYLQKKLEIPRRDDFFVATGEVEFGGGYEDTGYIDNGAFDAATKIHNDYFHKKCENKAGYYCKNKKCNFPYCVEGGPALPKSNSFFSTTKTKK